MGEWPPGNGPSLLWCLNMQWWHKSLIRPCKVSRDGIQLHKMFFFAVAKWWVLRRTSLIETEKSIRPIRTENTRFTCQANSCLTMLFPREAAWVVQSQRSSSLPSGGLISSNSLSRKLVPFRKQPSPALWWLKLEVITSHQHDMSQCLWLGPCTCMREYCKTFCRRNQRNLDFQNC